MDRNLAFDLHLLTARLDRAADRILTEALGVSYRRYLALLIVGKLEEPTQRALAVALEISEPSTSRMTTLLAEAGLLDVGPAAAGGNRRRLALTPQGKDLVDRGRELLETRFADLVARSGVPYASYSGNTHALLRALDESGVPGD
jgi:DNA-binding MarR family transcriptional regulator